MYPMFLVPHPDTPMVTFNHVWPLITQGSPLVAGLLVLDVVLILFFAALHLRLLVWNLGQFRAYSESQAFLNARGTAAEIGDMALPLTLAMAINVLFVLGALLVPDLWRVVEWLFPGAMLAFLAVGVLALCWLIDHLSRVLVHGGLDGASQNSLSPLLGVFTLAMVAVGLAAPAAMSQVQAVKVVAIVLALFFFSAAVLLALVQLATGLSRHAGARHRQGRQPQPVDHDPHPHPAGHRLGCACRTGWTTPLAATPRRRRNSASPPACFRCSSSLGCWAGRSCSATATSATPCGAGKATPAASR